MVDAYIAVGIDGAGKKVQTYSNVIAGETVHAEAYVLVDSLGALISPATEATLGTVHGHAHSIDAKITACNTGAVTVTSSDGLKAADLNIEAVSKDLQVDCKTTDVNQYSAGDLRGTMKGILAMAQDGTNIRPLVCTTNGIMFVHAYAYGNTIKDGTGTDYRWLIDANGVPYVQEPLPASYGVARIDLTATGDVVAASVGKVIYVLGYQIQGKGDVECCFADDTPADLGPEWDFNAREGAIAPIVKWPYYYFKTGAGKKLTISLDAVIRVTGNVQYVQV